jgi:uncharacterized protein YidB (DUF937 family)
VVSRRAEFFPCLLDVETFAMGLLDQLQSAFGSLATQAEAELLPKLLDKVLASGGLGSLQGLIDRLRAAGLDRQVESWLGGGPNEPITAQQLEAALGDDIVGKISGALDMPPDDIFGPLAAQLPGLIDKLSPHGHLQPA